MLNDTCIVPGGPLMTRSSQYFSRAVQEDPSYALAYSGLADAYALLGSLPNAELDRREAMEMAGNAALKAQELDETLAEAHTSLGFVKMQYHWDWAAAQREFKRAIELNPNYVTAHHWYGIYFMALGCADHAAAELRRAEEIDPLSPIVITDLGELYFQHGQTDKAIAQATTALEIDPNFALAHRLLGWANERKHMPAESISELRKAVGLEYQPVDACGAGTGLRALRPG